MRPKPILAAVALLVVLALIARQVSQAVKRTFTPPASLAQVAPTSPRTQNGLTLMEIDHVSPDMSYAYTEKGPHSLGGMSVTESDIGLWIKMPPDFSLPPALADCEDSADTGCGQVLSATAHLSSGLQIPLRWRTPMMHDSSEPLMLLVDIPAGYPNTFRWADVTLDDKRGDTATWRITHLPPMQHVLGPGTKAQTTFHQGSTLAHAAAYRGPDPNGNLKSEILLYDVTGTVKPSPHQWELGPMTQTREWEAPGYTALGGGCSYGTITENGATRFEAADQPVYSQQSQPYLADTHWVRLTAKLQEFETYDETVIFHNLSVIKTPTGNRFLVGPRPETVTTPSGVTVTLIDPRPDKDAHNLNEVATAELMIHFPASPTLASLPRSPLWRRFKGVVTLSCAVPKPYQDYGSSGNGMEGTYSFHSDRPLPKVIANFPVIVRQRVDLRSVPMTFTLPVEDGPDKQAKYAP